MEKKKFELTTDTKIAFGRKLFRIKALIDFGNVNKGELGGYVEKEENLSHEGNAWICDDACIAGNAKISGNAWIYDDVWIAGNAKISGNAWISGNAKISGNAEIYDDVWISGNAKISGNAWISGNVRIYGNAWIYDDVWIAGNVRIYGNAWISGNAKIFGNVRIYDDALIFGNDDYLCFKGLGSCNRNTTFFKCKDGHIHVSCGCFSGNLAEFEAKVKETHGESKFAKEYLACINVVKIHFEV